MVETVHMVVGTTHDSELQQLVFGTLPKTVGKRTDSTVIMTKRHLDIASRLSR